MNFSAIVRPVALAAMVAASALASAETKIGYVDWPRLVESAPQITSARDRLTQEFQTRNDQIAREEERLRELEDRLQRDLAVMSDSQAQNLERDIRSLRRDVQREREDLAEELDFRLQEERQKVESRIYDIVRDFAQENGFDLIVPGPALYVSDTMNLTDELIQRLQEAPANGTP